MKTLDKDQELRELQFLQRRTTLSARDLAARLLALNKRGIHQDELAEAIGKSQSQVSRLIRDAAKQHPADGEEKPAATAMELVRRRARGEIAHDQFVELLKTWDYDPSYKTEGLHDDWEFVDNSFDAVSDAWMNYDLLTDEEFEEIFAAVKGR
jgi:transcriptional regulator with XRE-family HTH domain